MILTEEEEREGKSDAKKKDEHDKLFCKFVRITK